MCAKRAHRMGWLILGGRFSTTKGAGFSSPSTSLRSGYHDVSIGKDVPSQCDKNINKYNETQNRI